MLGWAVETTLVAAGLATLATLAGRSRWWTPEACHALWLVVLLRFLVPPLLAWPWALGDRPGVPEVAPIVAAGPVSAPAPPRPDPAEPVPAAPIAVDAPVLPDPLAPPIPPVEPEPEPEPARSAVVALGSTPSATSPAVASDPAALPPVAPTAGPPLASIRLDWRLAPLAAWLVGSVVASARAASRVARFRRTLRLADRAPGWLVAEVAEVDARLGVCRPPPTLVVAGLPTPLLWCLGRPRLVLPTGLDRMPPAARAGLLAHELAHLARGDHWVVRVELLAGLIWWWNPVFRLAARRLRDAAEAACDARVVRACPEHRFAYAEALVEVCASPARPAPPLPALGIGGPRAARTLEARLVMILRDPIRPPSRRLAPLALALLALASPAWTRGQHPPEPPPAAPTGIPTEPNAAPQAAAVPPPATADAGQLAQLQAEVERLKGQLDAASKPTERQPADSARQGTMVLKARRDAQAAEVEKAEARRDRTRASSARAEALLQRNALGREEYDQIKADFKGAEAEVAGQRAKLAEADALLGRSDPAQPAGRDPVGITILRARCDAQAAEVAKAEARRDHTRADLARADSLLRRNAIGREDYDRIKAAVEVAEAEVAGQRAKLAEADALLGQAEHDPAAARRAGPGPADRAVLRARRDAQAAEVERVEAQRDQAVIEAKNTDNLFQKKGVSKNEVELFQAKLRAAEAEVAREKARLAEADAVIGQARLAPVPAADREPMLAERPTSLADLRDQVELAEMQIQAKRAELRIAEVRGDHAAKYAETRSPLAKEGRITQADWWETEAERDQAQDDARAKEVELLEAELRLKQARRREGAERARLKRLAERFKAESDRLNRGAREGHTDPTILQLNQRQYDELMLQLNPGYKPGAEPPVESDPPAAPPR